MAIYPLLFGHFDWPDGPTTRHRAAVDRDGRATLGSARVSVRVPAALKSRVEASAALEGLTPDAWIVRTLARGVDPRFDTP